MRHVVPNIQKHFDTMRVYMMSEEEKLILLHFILLCQTNMRISHIPRNESEKLMKSQIRFNTLEDTKQLYYLWGSIQLPFLH
jgi:hypothetical protein